MQNLQNLLQTLAPVIANAKQVLNAKEFEIFQLMLGTPAGGAVPYLQARPGIGKSATVASIAKKLNALFIDLRLSTMDETNLGSFPIVRANDKNVNVLTYASPNWAVKANEAPLAIIFLDEVNRAGQHLQNAILQMIQERTVGTDLKLKPTVLLVAAGNLGEADGTDVNDMDSALISRLNKVKFDITLDEWVENFAKENVLDLVVEFLQANPKFYYQTPKEVGDAFPTPRTWTFFSNTCVMNNAKFNEKGEFVKPNFEDVKEFAMQTLPGYVGPVAASAFVQFLNDRQALSVEDIMEGKFTEDTLDKLPRTMILDVANQLTQANCVDNVADKKFANIAKFFNYVGIEHADQKANFSQALYASLSKVMPELIADQEKFNATNSVKGLKRPNLFTYLRDNKSDVKRANGSK